MLLRTVLLIVLITLMSGLASAQTSSEIIVFVDADSLTVYMPRQAHPISLAGLGFAAGADTHFIEAYPSFRRFPFAAMPTPICLRLVRYTSNPSIPPECSGDVQMLVQILATGDVFWSGPAQQRLDLQIMRYTETVGFCDAREDRCNLTYHPLPETDAPLPAGTVLPEKILFTASDDGSEEIYSMDVDGSNRTRLTINASFDTFPAMSPDGSQIAFVSNLNVDFDIYVMNRDGTGRKQLLDTDQLEWGRPMWSPDGGQIAFVSVTDVNADIYVMDSDGSNVTPVIDYTPNDGFPSWSPDGTKLVFHSGAGQNYEIYKVNVDGTDLVQLTRNGSINQYPIYSPDGTKILFVSQQTGHTEIYTMNEDGSEQQRLTEDGLYKELPVWSPDGARIAFIVSRNNRQSIFIMDADGSNALPLTNADTDEMSVFWG